MKCTYLFVLPLICMQSLATDVYVSRDKHGNPQFSDQRSKNAQPHKVKPLPTVPALAKPMSNEPDPGPAATTPVYQKLAIIKPHNPHHLNTGMSGNINIQAQLQPDLFAGDHLELLLNGKTTQQSSSLAFSIDNLPRGEHSVELVVRSKDGQEKIRSQTLTLYVQRHAILHR